MIAAHVTRKAAMTSTTPGTSASQVDRPPLTRRGLPLDPGLRILAASTFAHRFGSGALMTTSALYFTRVAGFSPAHVALALSVAGLVGLLVQVPAGHLADTRGPREVVVATAAFTALLAATPVLARTPLELAVLMGALALFRSSGHAVRSGVIAQMARGGRGVQFKAYLRAVTNVSMGLGSLVGGLALLVDEPWAYVSVFVLDALLCAVSAVVTLRLPHLPPRPVVAGEPRLGVLRDVPYVVLTLLIGIFCVHFVVMDIGIVLYLAEHTTAPHVLISVLLVLNTAMVALFQVRLSHGSGTVTEGARSMLIASLFLAGGFALVALAGTLGAVLASVALVAGSLVHVVGEMVGSGGQWALQMGLAPHEKQGQYQGFSGLGWSLMEIFGPPVVVLLCVDVGELGWLVLGAIMVATALAIVPVSRWALTSRAHYGVTTHSG